MLMFVVVFVCCTLPISVVDCCCLLLLLSFLFVHLCVRVVVAFCCGCFLWLLLFVAVFVLRVGV